MRLVAAMLCLLSVTLSAGMASARAPLRFGVEDDAVFEHDLLAFGGDAGPGLMTADQGFAAGQSAGASMLKLRATWWRIERHPGQYDLTSLQGAVTASRARGWKVLVMLTGDAPRWATGDRRVSGNRPDPRQFAAFAGAVASGLNGQVDEFSIWNEPNWPRSLAPRAIAAARYRALFRAGSAAVRAVAPSAEVLIGELAPLGRPLEPGISPLRFLRQITCRDSQLRPKRHCAPLIADSLALHPYTLRWAPEFTGGLEDATMGSLGRATRLLKRLAAVGALRTPAGGALPLDLSEWAFHARPHTYPAARNPLYALQALRLACVQPQVRSLIWYQIQGSPPGPRRWDTGLLNHNGSPRPVFDALTHNSGAACPLTTPRGPR